MAASEKQILFTMITISAAEHQCRNIEFDLTASGCLGLGTRDVVEARGN
jgi:hypothetical protein